VLSPVRNRRRPVSFLNTQRSLTSIMDNAVNMIAECDRTVRKDVIASRTGMCRTRFALLHRVDQRDFDACELRQSTT
jgi:hypothetical protein